MTNKSKHFRLFTVSFSLFIRFSEEANPSQKYARRVVVVVVLRSNVYYEGLTKSEQLDGAVASGS